MMKKLISIFSIILFLASCDDLQTVIDIDLPPHESKLVINSSNQFGKPFRAYISHSIDPLSNDNSVSAGTKPPSRVKVSSASIFT